MAVKKGLGKGLDALFMDNDTMSEERSALTVKITEIEPNRLQPRKSFDEESLQQLADSIREHGVIQPILVRPLATGSYQIVAGERRWRASRIAGLKEVPIIVRELDDLAATQIALIENLQRENLNPVEEALGYKDLSENFNLTQAEIAESVGKSRSAVANSMRLLSLPKQVIEFLEQGRLSSGHARALLAFENEEDMLKVANMALDNKLTVRDVEKLASKKVVEVDENPKPKSRCRDSYYDEVEISLNEELHRKVKIKGKKAGTVEIAFYDKKDLEELIKLFNR